MSDTPFLAEVPPLRDIAGTAETFLPVGGRQSRLLVSVARALETTVVTDLRPGETGLGNAVACHVLGRLCVTTL